MGAYDSTCWEVIDGAARGRKEMREEFVRRYSRLVREYLGARWRGDPLLADIDDALAEVFVECFRGNGALERAEAGRAGGFRAFLLGVIRNVARRYEERRANARELQPTSGFDMAAALSTTETSLSHVLDRAWARTILDLAGARHRREAAKKGEEGLRRVELLRLRFEEGLPIREIARRWDVDPARLHQQYRQARHEFRGCLEVELNAHGVGPTGRSGDHWQEFLSLLS